MFVRDQQERSEETSYRLHSARESPLSHSLLRPKHCQESSSRVACPLQPILEVQVRDGLEVSKDAKNHKEACENRQRTIVMLTFDQISVLA